MRPSTLVCSPIGLRAMLLGACYGEPGTDGVWWYRGGADRDGRHLRRDRARADRPCTTTPAMPYAYQPA
eukprot:1525597-Rhodomonas_salina.1